MISKWQLIHPDLVQTNLLTLPSQTRRLVTYFSVSVCYIEGERCSKLIYPASVDNDAGHNSVRWSPASPELTNGLFLECWIKGNKLGAQVNYRWLPASHTEADLFYHWGIFHPNSQEGRQVLFCWRMRSSFHRAHAGFPLQSCRDPAENIHTGKPVMNSRCELGLHSQCQVMFIQKNMQLSSPLSAPHYHNCICGSSLL